MNIRFRIAIPRARPREFEFDRSRITIGRGPTNDVVIDDERVARRHGELRLDEAGRLWWHGADCGVPTGLRHGAQARREADGDDLHVWELSSGDIVLLGGAHSEVELRILAAEARAEAAPCFVPFATDDPTAAQSRLLLRLASDFARDPSPTPLLEAFSRLAAEMHHPATAASFVVISGGDDFHNDSFCAGADGDACPAPDPFATIPSDLLGDARACARSIIGIDDRVILPFGGPNVTSAIVVRCAAASPTLLRGLAVIATWLEPFAMMLVARRQLERERAAQAEENRHFRARQRRHYLFKELVCESDAMRRVHARLQSFQNDGRPVLILGEAGTGKELLARALHHSGSRADQILIRVSCAEHKAEAADFELFGSAPSDAAAARKGVFELARGGTVFLEEIDLLSPIVQAKLCRALKEGEVRRVGEAMGRPVESRLVASVHRDLDEAVAEGRLRRELYLLLKDQTIEVPPLRERREDIIPLAETFRTLFCARYGFAASAFTEEALVSLLAYPWPGNVRELQARVEAAVLDTRSSEITPASLGLSGV